MQKKKELCSYFVVKWHVTAQTFVMVDYVREIPAYKICKSMANTGLLRISSSFIFENFEGTIFDAYDYGT